MFSKLRLSIIYILFFSFFLIIILRLLFLFYSIEPSQKKKIVRKTKIVRGLIFDRKGYPLAINQERFSVYIHPHKVDFIKFKKNFNEIAKILNLSPQDLIKKINPKSSFSWLKRKGLDLKVIEKIKKLNIKGIHFKKENGRFYPLAEEFAQVIGFTGIDSNGLEGLEYLFEEDLNPVHNKTQKHNDYIQYGQNIVLSIDAKIQKILFHLLQETIQKYKAEKGTIILLNSLNGEILSIVNAPSYDNNRHEFIDQKNYRNFGISHYYEPGSLFKIISTAILLEKNKIKKTEKIYCSGMIQLFNRKITCPKEHGHITIKEILEKSCNVGIIKLARRFSDEDLYSFFKRLNLGEKTQIQIPGENPGHFKNLKQFKKISRFMMSFGYEIGITPLQAVHVLSSLLNGGLMFPIQIVQKQSRENTHWIKEKFNINKGKRVFSEKLSQSLHSLLEGTIKKEYFKKSNYSEFKNLDIVGKTGTSIIYDPEKNSYTDEINASFFSLIKRKWALIISISKPKGVSVSSSITVPLFYKILEALLKENIFYE